MDCFLTTFDNNAISNAATIHSVVGNTASLYKVNNDFVPLTTGKGRYFFGDNSIGAIVYLVDINHPRYYLSKPIMIAVKKVEDKEYIASIPEAEITRSGSTAKEAVDWLKSSMVVLYELFRRERELGPLPKKQLEVLGGYLVKKPRTTKSRARHRQKDRRRG